jgi:hypothetical protein
MKAVEKWGVGDKGVRESNGRGWMYQRILTVGRHWDTPLNINLKPNNEKQDRKIGIVGGVDWRKLRWQYMIDRLHITTWNRTKKLLAIALSGARRGLRVRDNEDNVTNVQYKSNQNCHYKLPIWQMYPNKIFYLKKTHHSRSIAL